MEINTILFLSLVALGAAVQTVTGFAMGLVVIAGVTALGLAEITFTAAVVGFISLTNALVALRYNWRSIERRFLGYITLGLLPGLVLGVLLLDYLSAQYYSLLERFLGFVIIGGGISLMITPTPYEKESRSATVGCFGVLGGVIGGLYSAGGAPIAYLFYRQPLAIVVIRATLLAIFAVSTFVRTLIVGVAGHIDEEVLLTVAAAVPLVIGTTMLVSRFVTHLPDKLVRRAVFIVLILVGCFLIVRG